MFKRICFRCKKKIDKSFDFCPFCGSSQRSKYDEEDYGILGKNDLINETSIFNSEDSFMEKVFDNAFKMAEKLLEKHIKEFPEMNKDFSKTKIRGFKGPHGNLNIQFFVNGKRVFPEKTEIKRASPEKINIISEKNKQKLATLPREEPSSKIRRVDGRIVYELSVPGVDDIGDVLINQLENSIEIKAISGEKIYSKTINMKLPILRYALKNGSLIVEMQGR